MSRNLNIASLLLFAIALLPIMSALLMLFSGSSEFTYEELMGMSASDIYDFNPKLMKAIELVVQLRGLYLLVFALFWAVISLIPYRKGEKWAWFAMLIIGIIWLSGYLIFVNIGVTQGIYLSSWITPAIVWLILWTAGLALPFKEFFKNNYIINL